MNKIKLLLPILALFVVACEDPASSNNDNDNNNDVTDTGGTDGGTDGDGLVLGLYTATSLTIYGNDECTGEGMDAVCWGHDTNVEADCPDGRCECDSVDSTITTYEACDEADGDWNGYECEVSCDAMTAADCSAASGVWSTGMCPEAGGDTTQEACEAEGYEWVNFGWLPLIDLWTSMESAMSYEILDDGTFTDMEGETGTYTVDGDIITLTFIEDGEEESFNGTINSDGSMTMKMTEPAECVCMDSDCELVADSEEACEAACPDGESCEFEASECTEFIFELSTGSRGW